MALTPGPFCWSHPGVPKWNEPAGDPGEPRPWDGSASSQVVEGVIQEFTDRWRDGEAPRVEQYLDRLPPDPDSRLEVLYHAYCLEAAQGRAPAPEPYIRGFPELRERFLRLVQLREMLSETGARSLREPPVELPEAGDAIGSFRLLRELGRGRFARVFLASDEELENRLLVLKVTNRPSDEHRHLARSPHPNIVSILRERRLEVGLQVIFMPFVGGAPLSSLLREARGRGQAWRRGAEFLEDLDRRSAPEFPSSAIPQETRTWIARTSWPRTAAWLTARLAEALDHAFEQGVTHGDLKPSNVLIAADARPILLDFNLSRRWRLEAGPEDSSDPGGTIAYMAPERLEALRVPSRRPQASPAERHQSDLYALGLLLLELLTSRQPSVPETPPRSIHALAQAIRHDRLRPESLSARLRFVPPGLRPILRRCLAPAPAQRYRKGSELARDLDRWRSDRPLVHASTPARVEAGRWVRRHRRAVLAGVGCVLLGVLVMLGTAKIQDTLMSRDLMSQSSAVAKLETLWNDSDFGAYALWDFNRQRRIAAGHPAERLARQIGAYGLIGEDDRNSLWERPDVAPLPEPIRSDFEAWIREQALRFGLEALRAKDDGLPGTPEQALTALERLTARSTCPAFEQLEVSLRRRLGRWDEPTDGPAPPLPSWLAAYLEGVLAEELEPEEAERLGFGDRAVGTAAAIERYLAVSRERPELFWPQYRAASMAYRLGAFAEAKTHMEVCLEHRPDCAPLWTAMAGTLYQLGRVPAAIEANRRALELDPHFEAAWRNLALLAASEGFEPEVDRALDQLRRLARGHGTASAHQVRFEARLASRERASEASEAEDEPLEALRQRLFAFDPDNVPLRYGIATKLHEAGRFTEALSHYDRILELEPAHSRARFNRAVARQRTGDKSGALVDYQRLVDHPDYSVLLERVPGALIALTILSADRIRAGETEAALALAERAREEADRIGHFQAEAHYALARAYAAGAETNASRLNAAVDHLNQARDRQEDFLTVRFANDAVFDPARADLLDMLEARD